MCGAIIKDRRVLIALRGPGRDLAGLWELPGGKVESGEADAQALVRELREELGVQVQVGERIGVSEHEGGTRPLVLVAYACTLIGGSPQPLEHRALEWVGERDLLGRAWAPADVPLLKPLQQLLC
ncbi:MAG: (deoxy)nucleoside triphosphate pyrophosphohydrolase [Myxococcota bacterium]